MVLDLIVQSSLQIYIRVARIHANPEAAVIVAYNRAAVVADVLRDFERIACVVGHASRGETGE